jgi:hypothetical protein
LDREREGFARPLGGLEDKVAGVRLRKQAEKDRRKDVEERAWKDVLWPAGIGQLDERTGGSGQKDQLKAAGDGPQCVEKIHVQLRIGAQALELVEDHHHLHAPPVEGADRAFESQPGRWAAGGFERRFLRQPAGFDFAAEFGGELLEHLRRGFTAEHFTIQVADQCAGGDSQFLGNPRPHQMEQQRGLPDFARSDDRNGLIAFKKVGNLPEFVIPAEEHLLWPDRSPGDVWIELIRHGKHP